MIARSSRYLAFLVVAIGIGGFTLVLVGVATAVPAIPRTIDRDLEPVLLTGSDVESFAGISLDELFFYAYRQGSWKQIPAQVDEVNVDGAYVAHEDGLLDDNDEIVLMVKDLGNLPPAEAFITYSLPVSETWYRIRVFDPISPTKRGWAYLYRSKVLTHTATTDYVDFAELQLRINAGGYSLGMATDHAGYDYLALGGSGVDVVDRTKIRLYSSLLPPLTEESLGPQPHDVVKDGPVRVLLRSGKVQAFESMVQWSISFDPLPPFYRQALRFSTDFAEAAIGSTLYSSVITEGVAVDGSPDQVAAEPLSAWWQVSTADGTMVQVGDANPLRGDRTNYYLDDMTWDPEDTGDGRSYGDVGVHVQDPRDTFSYTYALYFLEGDQPNVGATYEEYFTEPVAVVATREGLEVKLDAEHEYRLVGDTTTLTATVLNYAGEPQAGRVVSFTVASGVGTITPPVAVTDETGQAMATLGSEVAGTVLAQAWVGAVDSRKKIVVFLPGPVDRLTLDAHPETLVVGHSSTLTATVMDEYDNPIGGKVVEFAILDGSGTLSPTQATSDELGRALTSLTSDVAGSVVARATSESVSVNSRIITFLARVHLPLLLRNTP